MHCLSCKHCCTIDKFIWINYQLDRYKTYEYRQYKLSVSCPFALITLIFIFHMN